MLESALGWNFTLDMGQCRADGFGPAHLVLGGGRLKGVQLFSGQPDRNELRWLMLPMITEYAQHCGHVDLLREGIDGRTGA